MCDEAETEQEQKKNENLTQHTHRWNPIFFNSTNFTTSQFPSIDFPLRRKSFEFHSSSVRSPPTTLHHVMHDEKPSPWDVFDMRAIEKETREFSGGTFCCRNQPNSPSFLAHTHAKKRISWDCFLPAKKRWHGIHEERRWISCHANVRSIFPLSSPENIFSTHAFAYTMKHQQCSLIDVCADLFSSSLSLVFKLYKSSSSSMEQINKDIDGILDSPQNFTLLLSKKIEKNISVSYIYIL